MKTPIKRSYYRLRKKSLDLISEESLNLPEDPLVPAKQKRSSSLTPQDRLRQRYENIEEMMEKFSAISRKPEEDKEDRDLPEFFQYHHPQDFANLTPDYQSTDIQVDMIVISGCSGMPARTPKKIKRGSVEDLYAQLPKNDF